MCHCLPYAPPFFTLTFINPIYLTFSLHLLSFTLGQISSVRPIFITGKMQCIFVSMNVPLSDSEFSFKWLVQWSRGFPLKLFYHLCVYMHLWNYLSVRLWICLVFPCICLSLPNSVSDCQSLSVSALSFSFSFSFVNNTDKASRLFFMSKGVGVFVFFIFYVHTDRQTYR